MGWIRYGQSSAPRVSAILCIRGSRSSHHRPNHELKRVSLATVNQRVMFPLLYSRHSCFYNLFLYLRLFVLKSHPTFYPMEGGFVP